MGLAVVAVENGEQRTGLLSAQLRQARQEPLDLLGAAGVVVRAPEEIGGLAQVATVLPDLGPFALRPGDDHVASRAHGSGVVAATRGQPPAAGRQRRQIGRGHPRSRGIRPQGERAPGPAIGGHHLHGEVATGDRLAAQVAPGFLDTLGQLWSRRSFRYLALAGSLQSLAGYGVGNFMPSFIIRAHDMAIGDIGWRLALITGLGGAIAIVTSGFITDRLAARSQAWYALFPAIAIAVTVPLALLVFLADNSRAMFLAYIPYELLGATWLGASLAVTHSLVGLRQRAVASAVLFFLVNLIGLGLGPLLIGTISDLLRPGWGDADGLRWAILSTALVAKTAAVAYFLLAARSLRRDLET